MLSAIILFDGYKPFNIVAKRPKLPVLRANVLKHLTGNFNF